MVYARLKNAKDNREGRIICLYYKEGAINALLMVCIRVHCLSFVLGVQEETTHLLGLLLHTISKAWKQHSSLETAISARSLKPTAS